MDNRKRQVTKFITQKQDGQTLVEFILLLSAVAIISFTFMSQVNRLTGERWRDMAQVLVEDETQVLQLR